MENKKLITEIRRYYKDNLPSVKKIIKYQEIIYNMVYRDGKWIRRYNAKNKANKEIKKENKGLQEEQSQIRINLKYLVKIKEFKL